MPLVRRRAAGLHLGKWLGLSPTGVAALRDELHRLLPDSPEEGKGCYFLVFVQLFEKYGTFIERYTALIEKVSALIVSKIHVTVAAANVLLRQAGPVPAELPLQVGESAVVYSRSAGGWLPGRVVAFERGGKGAKNCFHLHR
eukprot:SAG31_NODE_3638_length_4034_cov_4.484371_2_plen_142_part_00